MNSLGGCKYKIYKLICCKFCIYTHTHTHTTPSRQKIYTMTQGKENYDDRGGVEDWEYVVWGEEVHAVLY